MGFCAEKKGNEDNEDIVVQKYFERQDEIEISTTRPTQCGCEQCYPKQNDDF